MFIYQFEQSSGYYSEILTHKEKFSAEELESICKEIDVEGPYDLDKKINWLIEHKGFERVNYMLVDLDEYYVQERGSNE